MKVFKIGKERFFFWAKLLINYNVFVNFLLFILFVKVKTQITKYCFMKNDERNKEILFSLMVLPKKKKKKIKNKYWNAWSWKYSRCFWQPATFCGQSQAWVSSLYSRPPIQNCSVAVPFQQVQYLVQLVSWPKIPYSQSQCSVLWGGSK